MTYAATALARSDGDWHGDDVELDELEDLDGLVELLGQVVGDDNDVTLLLVEEDDEWLGVVRVDSNGDPRVFVSDPRVLESSHIAGLLAEGVIDVDIDDDEGADDDDASASSGDDDDETAASVDSDPVGDLALLADLGTSAANLVKLCNAESTLPGDIITEICEAAGCLDVLEKLRGL